MGRASLAPILCGAVRYAASMPVIMPGTVLGGGSGAVSDFDFSEGSVAVVEGEGLVTIVKKVGRRVRVELGSGKMVWWDHSTACSEHSPAFAAPAALHLPTQS